MMDTDIDADQIDALIAAEFPKATLETRLEMVGSAWLFLAKEKIESIDELSQQQMEALKKFVKRSWRDVRIDGSSGGTRGGSKTSDDEFLSFLALQNDRSHPSELRREIEVASETFEQEKGNIRSKLSPVLYEAFDRCITKDAAINWTAGFGRNTLRILCRRALMRLRFLSGDDPTNASGG